ncbi:alpha/beta fold hydrolase [Agrococcus jejuensis]|uniref:Lysophospholipase, alpha-beta hydrolase superfamily n=1 Tax=Agrococcus jejuensis TaxID=399736 RepID=A0A1G8EPC7_9MICO|nr:hypothetical protein [Agrococcus jejuensis]SDH71677.1 Lysophospholipase, alpha-beta hydrolase superfamily [Agrococcus jejuensis]
MTFAPHPVTAIDVVPAATTRRGRVLVLQGRGDAPAHYARLANRLAVDGYEVGIAQVPPATPAEVAAAWAAFVEGTEQPQVVVAADTAAGLVAAALAEGIVDASPSAVVLAGLAVPGAARAEAEGDETQELRSACPIHAGVVRAAGARALADSAIDPVWPEGAAALPVLAIHGAADAIAPLEDATALLARWHAEVVVVAGGLHDVLNDVAHRSVAAEIVQLLERVRLDAAAAPILERRAA